MGGLFTYCATLNRYEGWALLAAGIVLVLVWSRLADSRAKSGQANIVLFSAVAGYGIVLWFLYNLIIFHDPLYFLHSAYSAQAINGSQAQFGLLGTKGNVLESLLTCRAGRTAADELANFSSFGLVWVVQYVILDKIVFRHRTTPRDALLPALDDSLGFPYSSACELETADAHAG